MIQNYLTQFFFLMGVCMSISLSASKNSILLPPQWPETELIQGFLNTYFGEEYPFCSYARTLQSLLALQKHLCITLHATSSVQDMDMLVCINSFLQRFKSTSHNLCQFFIEKGMDPLSSDGTSSLRGVAQLIQEAENFFYRTIPPYVQRQRENSVPQAAPVEDNKKREVLVIVLRGGLITSACIFFYFGLQRYFSRSMENDIEKFQTNLEKTKIKQEKIDHNTGNFASRVTDAYARIGLFKEKEDELAAALAAINTEAERLDKDMALQRETCMKSHIASIEENNKALTTKTGWIQELISVIKHDMEEFKRRAPLLSKIIAPLKPETARFASRQDVYYLLKDLEKLQKVIV